MCVRIIDRDSILQSEIALIGILDISILQSSPCICVCSLSNQTCKLHKHCSGKSFLYHLVCILRIHHNEIIAQMYHSHTNCTKDKHSFQKRAHNFHTLLKATENQKFMNLYTFWILLQPRHFTYLTLNRLISCCFFGSFSPSDFSSL